MNAFILMVALLALVAALFAAARRRATPAVAVPPCDLAWAFELEPVAALFSPAEARFHAALTPVAAELGLLVFPKIGLNDLFKDRPGAPRGQYNRYAQLHVDFLLVTRDGHKPVAGIELDGASHRAARQAARDEKKDAVFAGAGLPLLRFFNEVLPGPAELRQKLEDGTGHAATQVEAAPGR